MKRRYLVQFIITLLSNQVILQRSFLPKKDRRLHLSKPYILVLRSKKAPVFIRGTRHRQRLSRPQSPDRTKVRIGPLMKSFETRFEPNDDPTIRSQSVGPRVTPAPPKNSPVTTPSQNSRYN